MRRRPLSYENDEMMFIIVHQTSELWMRLVLHELDGVFKCVQRDNLGPYFQEARAHLTRADAAHRDAGTCLSTMTPFDYSAFRNALGRSSGFQSFQYRMLEFRLGNKNADMVAVHKRDPQAYEALQAALAAPSLYDEVLRLLSRRGYGIPEDYVVARLHGSPIGPASRWPAPGSASITTRKKDWDLYELAERLVDLDHKFQLWRFHHLKTVERIIGYKPGTGGTGGVSYLAKALELKFFPELWQVRTSM